MGCRWRCMGSRLVLVVEQGSASQTLLVFPAADGWGSCHGPVRKTCRLLTPTSMLLQMGPPPTFSRASQKVGLKACGGHRWGRQHGSPPGAGCWSVVTKLPNGRCLRSENWDTCWSQNGCSDQVLVPTKNGLLRPMA